MAAKTKRTLNPAAKRTAIMDAGEALFASRGYTGTTMADVARTARVAVGTVYRLFPDKPALLAALHRQMEDRFLNAMDRGWTAAPDLRDRFGPMIHALFDAARDVLHLMPLYSLTRDMVGATDFVPGQRMIAAIEKQYGQGVAAGAFRPYPAPLAASIAHGMVDGAMRAWMADPSAARQKAITAHLADLFNDAFLAPETGA